jgi:hypothetical protein
MELWNIGYKGKPIKSGKITFILGEDYAPPRQGFGNAMIATKGGYPWHLYQYLWRNCKN